MFEDLLKALKTFEQTKEISIPIETDEKGYLDKQCPSVDCEFKFKVNQDDWANIFNDEAVWCPLCRHEAASREWFTIEQIEHAKAEAFSIIKGSIHNAMISDAQRFNSKHRRDSFVSMSLEVKGSVKRTHAIPAQAAEAMQLEIKCEQCDSRFAVIGSAYFCPGCGYNSVSRTFSDSLRKIKAKIDNVELVRMTLAETVGKDEAEVTCRSLVESCILDGVVAIQKLCERLYEQFGKAPFNAFQRLKQGSELWAAAIGEGYSSWLTEQELKKLNILFQKRHILAHNEGIVDENYIKNSGDTSYKIGQRIVVSQKDIEEFLYYLDTLSQNLCSAINKIK